MSDIRSFFGGKAAPVKAAPAVIVGKSAGNVEPSVAKNSPSAAVAVQALEDEPKPTHITSSDLPSDVQKIITWNAGESVPYLALVEIFEEISQTSGRLEKENLFARLFRAVISTTPNDLDVIVYLASNEVSPVYDGKELGIGDSLLVKAVCEATGRKKDAVEEAYEKEGDLGTVALMSRANQKTLSFAAKPKPLLARYVLDQFRLITQIKGDKAQGRKVEVIKSLMVKCQGSEAKFIVRALQGKLRIGTAQQTVLVALAHAISDAQLHIPEESALEPVRAVLAKQAEEWRLKGGDKALTQEQDLDPTASSVMIGEEVEDGVDAESDAEMDADVKISAKNKTSSSTTVTVSKRTNKSVIQDDEEEEEDEGEKEVAVVETTVETKVETTELQESAQPEKVAEDTMVIETEVTVATSAEGIDPSTSDSSVEKVAEELIVNLEEKIASIPEKATPESIKLRSFALALYSAQIASNSKAEAAAHRKLSKELRWQCAEVAVKRAFSECPNLSLLSKHLLTLPLHDLHRASCLSIGLPVAPMLAKPTKQIGEVLKRLSGLAFTMEYKYDGERAQVHLLPDGSVKIYSRNSEDNSEKYPDLRDIVKTAKMPEVNCCILDAEVVAYDREQRCLLPFQVLSTRKRKVEAGEEDTQKVKVILQIFDLLYLNGRSLLRESLRSRRALMQNAFTHTEGMLHFASGLDHVENGDTGPIEVFLQEACAAMCEGLMVKTLDDNASYEPSKRSMNWLKLKKDYIDGMGVCDSVDLVVIGGYLGRGKRVNTYGAYLMACYDPDRDEYQSVCKVGTGFKDEDLARLYAQMKPLTVGSHRRPLNYNVNDVLTPDHWFEASVVWELQAADLSKSSVHSGGAGRVEAGRGIGLRFPRYIRDREDKKAELATTAEQIVEMFHNQGLTSEGGGAAGGGADDDDDWL